MPKEEPQERRKSATPKKYLPLHSAPLRAAPRVTLSFVLCLSCGSGQKLLVFAPSRTLPFCPTREPMP